RRERSIAKAGPHVPVPGRARYGEVSVNTECDEHAAVDVVGHLEHVAKFRVPMRLFCAIDIGSTAKDLVAAEQARLAKTVAGSSLRWVKHDHLHLTLVFLGEISEERAGPVIDAMRDPIPQPSFSLPFGGLGVF